MPPAKRKLNSLTWSDVRPLAIALSRGSDARYRLTGELRSLYAQSLPDGSWTAGTLDVTAHKRQVTIVGRNLPGLQIGRSIDVEGFWEQHPEHGWQFRAESCTRSQVPTESTAVARYLTANVEGIGARSAELLVTVLGATEALATLLRNPEMVRQFVSPRQAERAFQGLLLWRRDVEREKWCVDVAPKLMAVGGVGYATARRIVNYFGGADVSAVMAREEPYRLLEVPGIGWNVADAIAQHFGVAPLDDDRLEAAVLCAAGALRRRGHSGASVAQLLAYVERHLIQGRREETNDAIQRCVATGDLIESCDALFELPVLAEEWAITRLVERLLSRRFELTDPQRQLVEATIAAARPALTPDQAAAVRSMAERGFSILTGRPGAGKTHALRTVVAAAKSLGLGTAIVAPTGKAAARVQQLTQVPATTIHKKIGGPVGGVQDPAIFGRGLLVIDEASMVDASVMAWIAGNTEPGSDFRLLVVGDRHQLPSVGHGQVLADLISSGVGGCTDLQHVHRAAMDSRITLQANRLLDELPLLEDQTHDWRFVELPANPEAARKSVVKEVRRVIHEERTSLLRNVGGPAFDARRDLQLLTARNLGPLGVHALNDDVRAIVNPNGELGPHIRSDDASAPVRARIGDRVMCVENDYSVGDDGLMNGEQGVVVAVERGGMRVLLDGGRTVQLRGVQTTNMMLAFCATVHRAQGSEYPVVVVAYHSSHGGMLDRRLLYTAVTRARQRVVLCADRIALANLASSNQHRMARTTGLAVRLRHAERRALGLEETQ